MITIKITSDQKGKNIDGITDLHKQQLQLIYIVLCMYLMCELNMYTYAILICVYI